MFNDHSKRFPIRLIPEDRIALDRILSSTSYSTKSDIIRGALVLFHQLWFAASHHCRVVIRHDELRKQYGLLDNISSANDQKNLVDPGLDQGEPSASGELLEVRLTATEDGILNALLQQGAGVNRADIIRRALSTYLHVVSRNNDGWEVGAISQDSFVPFVIPGLIGLASVAHQGHSDTTGVENEMALSEGSATNGGLLLPAALTSSADRLAKLEGCPVESLVIDVLRSGIESRLAVQADPWETLAQMPRNSVDALIDHHLRVLWKDVVICFKEPLDDQDAFFPTVIKHLRSSTRLYYIHSDPDAMPRLLNRLERIGGANDLQYRVRKLISCVEVSDSFIEHNGTFVLFNVHSDDIGGYSCRISSETIDWDILDASQIQNVLRNIKPLLTEADSKLDHGSRLLEQDFLANNMGYLSSADME